MSKSMLTFGSWGLAGLLLLVVFSSCLRTRDQIREQNSFQAIITPGDQGTLPKKSTPIHSSEDDGEYIRQLTGRVEELESRLRVLGKRLESGVEQNRVEELERRLQLLLEELKNQKAELENLRVTIQEEFAQQQKNQIPEKDAWQQAEDYFAAQDWRKAILSYQKFRDQNPKSPKFILATYKIAICFEKLNMKTEAVAFYEEVLEKAPKSEEAKKAKLRLKKLK